MNTTTTATTAKAIIWTVKPENALTDRQIDNRLKKLSELEEQIKSMKKEADTLKQAIIDGMSAEHITTSNFKVNYSTFTRQSIDTTALKKAMPEIAEQFTKESIQHRFTYSAI